MILSSFIHYLTGLSYWGVAAYSGTVGYFVPVPEEAAFILFGYLSGLGKFQFGYVFLAAVGGILIADHFFYLLAYWESRYLLHFKTKVKDEVWAKYEQLMKNNIGKTMTITRFLIGFRFLGPVIAGSLKIPYRRFLLYEVTIISVYVGGLMYLGFTLRRRALYIIGLIEQFRSVFLIVIGLIIIVVLLGVVLRRSGRNE